MAPPRGERLRRLLRRAPGSEGGDLIAAVLLLALAAAPEDAAADSFPADSVPVDSAPAAAPADPASGNGSPVGARLFETWELGLDAGVLFPAGRLAEILDPAPSLGFSLVSSYYGRWRAWGSVDLARLDGAASPAAVGMASGAAGLLWSPASAWIPAPGIGLAYHYVRALERHGPADEYLFLEDGESEFGSRAALRWSVPCGKRVALLAGARWDMMFTAPDYGHAFAIHLGAAWTRR